MIRRFSCEFVSPFSKINLPTDITLHHTILSPPSRSVLLVAKVLGIKLELKNVDVQNGEHLTPDFLKVYDECMSVCLTRSKKIFSVK